MHYFDIFINFLNQIPSDVWEVLIAALFLSPFMVGVKKWLNVNRELVMTLYVIFGAFILSAVAYVNSNPTAAPWLVIPIQALVTFAVSQPVYFAIVKPLRKRGAVWLEEANKLNEAKRAAALPANGALPADFS